jgi:hypothetical protein
MGTEMETFYGVDTPPRIYSISRVYLKELEAVNIEGAEAFLKSQGTTLKHLNIGPTILSSAFHHVSASRNGF